MSEKPFDFATAAIHGGRPLVTPHRPINQPIFQSSAFVHECAGDDPTFSYSRVSNPTVAALEEALGAFEQTPPTVCFRTGMAAITALFFSLLRAGDHVVLSRCTYGGVVRLFDELLTGLGVTGSFVDARDLANVEAAITPATKLIFIETPANPTLELIDIAAAAELAHRHGLPLVVDNTFLTPVLQQPLALGADITVLSTTKHVDGNNAAVGGSVATRDEKLLERLRLIRKTVGSIQAPFDAWLTLQGLKTLPLRIERQSANARAIADWLEAQPSVERVLYPELASFPQRELACRQQRLGGGLLSFSLRDVTRTTDFMNALRLCHLAESLGGAETFVTHPAATTHADVPVERRNALGIHEGLLRISAGLESPEAIIADLAQALAVIA